MSDLDVKSTGNSILCSDYRCVSWLDWVSCPCRDDVAILRFCYPDETPNPPDWREWIPPDEILRARRYHRETDRLRSLYTRSLIRILVGKYTSQHPLAIRLTVDLKGKPVLPDHPEWL